MKQGKVTGKLRKTMEKRLKDSIETLHKMESGIKQEHMNNYALAAQECKRICEAADALYQTNLQTMHHLCKVIAHLKLQLGKKP